MALDLTDRLVIRGAVASEATAISALICRAVRLANARDYPPRVIESVTAGFSPEAVRARMVNRRMYVALLDGAIVGTLSLGHCKIASLFVEPDCHGQGIGRHLVAFAERRARGWRMAELTLSASITARRFYERLGYECLTFEERIGGSTFLMRKQLC